MKLTNHILDEAKRSFIFKTDKSMNTRRVLVIHFTSGATGLSSVNYWRLPETKASAHFVIERTGEILQCVPCNVQAWHAGVSSWTDPKTKILYKNLNSCSIGIELANAGNFDDISSDKVAKLPGFTGVRTARHKLDSHSCIWEQYPTPQLRSCMDLAKLLVKSYNLDAIVGHDDISPDRKRDPGPLFPMSSLQNFCGLTVTDSWR